MENTGPPTLLTGMDDQSVGCGWSSPSLSLQSLSLVDTLFLDKGGTAQHRLLTYQSTDLKVIALGIAHHLILGTNVSSTNV